MAWRHDFNLNLGIPMSSSRPTGTIYMFKLNLPSSVPSNSRSDVAKYSLLLLDDSISVSNGLVLLSDRSVTLLLDKGESNGRMKQMRK